jgi:hypothetical protein
MDKIISDEYKKIILETIDGKLPSKRKPKYSNSYYLENIIYVLKDVVSYASLQIIHKDKKPNHYKTICDKHKEWADNDIFKISFEKLAKKYTFIDINSHSTLDLFIDSTSIINKNGSESAN